MQTKTINIIVGGLAVLAVIFGVSYLKPPKVEVSVNVPEQSESPFSYGAVSTLDGVDNPYVKINGLDNYYYSAPIAATSSVFCSVRNPYAPATTSVVALGTRILGTISAASTYDIATGTTQYQNNGSSTPAFAVHTVGAGLKDAYNWRPRYATTTGVLYIRDFQADPEDPYFLVGTQFLNWKIATATPGTDYYEGTCTALFRKM